MSAAALRVLPYYEEENRLLPSRLVRPPEAQQEPLKLIDLKAEVRDDPEKIISSLSRVLENNGEPPTFPSPSEELRDSYPDSVVRIFAGGAILTAIGLILLVVMVFASARGVGLASASCLIVGTTAVALSLLRGHDLEESAG